MASPRDGSFDAEAARAAIAVVQQSFLDGLSEPFLRDVAFVGNTSDVYPWDPSPIIDIDVCLIVARKDRVVGQWLLDLGVDLRRRLNAIGVDFLLRVVRGHFKPSVHCPERPVAIAHLAVMTEEGYSGAAAGLRLSWRKYRCVVDPGRFARLAPAAVPPSELARTVRRKLRRLERGQAEMTEWTLPDLEPQTLTVTLADPTFAEYCVGSSMVCARAHARQLGHSQADKLPNDAFFPWYSEHVFRSAALDALVAIKARLRAQGFEGQTHEARDLAARYFAELLERLGGPEACEMGGPAHDDPG